jgi:hypothetical protein
MFERIGMRGRTQDYGRAAEEEKRTYNHAQICKICSIGIAYSIEGHYWRFHKCLVLADRLPTSTS